MYLSRDATAYFDSISGVNFMFYFIFNLILNLIFNFYFQFQF